MDTINKKEEIFNKFNDLFKQIINIDSPESIVETTNTIKAKTLNIGADILEYWIKETFENELENKDLLDKNIKYKGLVEKTYLSALGEIKIKKVIIQLKRPIFFKRVLFTCDKRNDLLYIMFKSL